MVWEAGTDETVTWDVADTDLLPIDCAQVDIVMSADGGLNYPHIVETGRPNDGAEPVTVPDTIPSTTQARLKVQCTGNIFFDISDVDFEVTNPTFIFADGFESGDTMAWSSSVP